MNLLEIREKEIFSILKEIRNQKFVLIGGYAVNAYTLPRFSVDCDIVVEGEKNVESITRILISQGYEKKEADKTASGYYGAFFRYEKELAQHFKVSMDILMNAVLDRQTNAAFAASWVIENSSPYLLRGKTIFEEVTLQIITIDALIAMKCVSCRSTDIRDIFMLIVHAKNTQWIRDEVEKRTAFKDKASKIVEKVSSSTFKNNLQGVYGSIDEKIFEKHKKLILSFSKDVKK